MTFNRDVKRGDVLRITTNSFFMVPSTGEVKCLENNIVMCLDLDDSEVLCWIYHPEYGRFKIATRYLEHLD